MNLGAESCNSLGQHVEAILEAVHMLSWKMCASFSKREERHKRPFITAGIWIDLARDLRDPAAYQRLLDDLLHMEGSLAVARDSEHSYGLLLFSREGDPPYPIHAANLEPDPSGGPGRVRASARTVVWWDENGEPHEGSLAELYEYMSSQWVEEAAQFRDARLEREEIPPPPVTSQVAVAQERVRPIFDSDYPMDQLLAAYMTKRAQEVEDQEAAWWIVSAYDDVIRATTWGFVRGHDLQGEFDDLILSARHIAFAHLVGALPDDVRAVARDVGRADDTGESGKIPRQLPESMIGPTKVAERYRAYRQRVPRALIDTMCQRIAGALRGGCIRIEDTGDDTRYVPTPDGEYLLANLALIWAVCGDLARLVARDRKLNERRYDPGRGKLGAFFRARVKEGLDKIWPLHRPRTTSLQVARDADTSYAKISSANGDERLNNIICKDRLNRLFASMEAEERLLLERHLEGRTQTEIAAELGCSQPTVSRKWNALVLKLPTVSTSE